MSLNGPADSDDELTSQSDSDPFSFFAADAERQPLLTPRDSESSTLSSKSRRKHFRCHCFGVLVRWLDRRLRLASDTMIDRQRKVQMMLYWCVQTLIYAFLLGFFSPVFLGGYRTGSVLSFVYGGVTLLCIVYTAVFKRHTFGIVFAYTIISQFNALALVVMTGGSYNTPAMVNILLPPVLAWVAGKSILMFKVTAIISLVFRLVEPFVAAFVHNTFGTFGIGAPSCQIMTLPVAADDPCFSSYYYAVIIEAMIQTFAMIQLFLLIWFQGTVQKNLDDARVAAERKAAREFFNAERAREASAEKTRFVSVMSHEIRNPLNSVKATSMLLMDGLTEKDEDYQYLKQQQSAIDAILHIINDVLDVNKIEAGAVQLDDTSVDMRALIESVCQTVQPRAAEQCTDIMINIDPTISTNCRGDPVRLRQIFTNYIGNAIKFTESGWIRISLVLEESIPLRAPEDDASDSSGPRLSRKQSRMTTPMHSGQSLKNFRQQESQRWRFEVEDSGIGISDDVQGELFTAFRQGNQDTTRKYGGTGLGLYIVKKLTDLMSGSCGVDSVLDRGSKFFATFCVYNDPAADMSKPPQKFFWPQSAKTNSVCVLADEDEIVDYLSGMLGSMKTDIEISEFTWKGVKRNKQARLYVVDDNALRDDTERQNALIKNINDTDSRVVIMTTGRSTTNESGWSSGLRSKIFVKLVQKPVIGRHLFGRLREAATESATLRGSIKRMRNASRRKKQAVVIADDAPQLLIVDDMDDVRKIIAISFERKGIRVHQASGGQEAIDFVSEHHDELSLVLMDCDMPVIDGFEATRQIRQQEELKGQERLSIFAFTGHAFADNKNKAEEAGMDQHISKPITEKSRDFILWKLRKA